MNLSYAEQRLQLRFASATLEVAQHPSAGLVMVGATALRYLNKGQLTTEQVLNFGAKGTTPEAMAQITAGAHALMGAYGVDPAKLQNPVGFAKGLVGNGFVTTVAEMGKRQSGVALPELEVATSEQVAHFTDIARDPVRLQYVQDVLGAVATTLTEINNSDVQDPIDEYHQRILAVSRQYADDHNNPARMAELGAARDGLAADLTEPVVTTLSEYMGLTDAMVTTHNILRHNPGPELLGTHFGNPQA
jgi:hypothetical protein